MGNVIAIQFSPLEPEIILSSRELAAQIGYEPVGISRLVRQGMPVYRGKPGYRMFRVEPVLVWLLESGRKGRNGKNYEAMLREHREIYGRGRIPEPLAEKIDPPPISA